MRLAYFAAYHMAEIINLRQARKDKQRRERESEAAENRRRFGRTKAQKRLDEDATERARQSIDDKRLEDDPQR